MAADPLPQHSTPETPDPSPTSWIQRIKLRIKKFYENYEKYSEMAIFGIGFIWDSLTMTRVDSLLDDIILSFYQIIIGILIIYTLRRQNGMVPHRWFQKIESRFTWVMQFCFGGLFSSYVIFYFKSASFSQTQFFFLLLVGLWIGNEFLRDRLNNRILLSVLYSFCLFAFLAFFLPVLLTIVKPWVFVLAGVISAVVSLIVFALGLRTEGVDWKISLRPVVPWILGVFLLLNVLYFANLIPPVPLAMKFGHPYHYVKKTSDGYEVKYAPQSYFRFWRKWDDPFYWTPGENIYCFTAVFAPTKVHVPLIHIWKYKTADGWKKTDRMRFAINGGRDGGYRLYSKKSGVKPGEWRVEVQTETGQILGKIDFTVIPDPEPNRQLQTNLIQ
jgi:hypothetical protein